MRSLHGEVTRKRGVLLNPFFKLKIQNSLNKIKTADDFGFSVLSDKFPGSLGLLSRAFQSHLGFFVPLLGCRCRWYCCTELSQVIALTFCRQTFWEGTINKMIFLVWADVSRGAASIRLQATPFSAVPFSAKLLIMHRRKHCFGTLGDGSWPKDRGRGGVGPGCFWAT